MEALNCEFALAGVASRALPGQAVCGDSHVVAPFADGILVAAIDGLGHGPEAAIAGDAAVEAILGCVGKSPTSVMKHCHERLQGTRGAVMSVASFNAIDGAMTWLGIGNVEACLLRANLRTKDMPYVLARGGVVGHSLPDLRAETLEVRPGDTLIMATDGIRSGFSRELDPLASPQEIADTILARFARETDDALVLAVRWLGRRT